MHKTTKKNKKDTLRMPKEKQKIPVEPTLPAKSHARLYRKMLEKQKKKRNAISEPAKMISTSVVLNEFPRQLNHVYLKGTCNLSIHHMVEKLINQASWISAN